MKNISIPCIAITIAIIASSPFNGFSQCDYLFDHDLITPVATPLVLGHTESQDGINMTTTEFDDGITPALWYNNAIAAPVTATSVFGSGNTMILSLASAIYDLSAHACADVVTIEYFDGAGIENLQVNGATLYINEFEFMPTMVAPGVTMSVSETNFGPYAIGTLTFTGAPGSISKILIGGQQFEVDDIRAFDSSIVPPSAGCFGGCDVLFDMESLSAGHQWGDVVPSLTADLAFPGDVLFSVGAVDLYIDELQSLSGFVGFNYIAVDNSMSTYFGSPQSITLNNTCAGFDFSTTPADTVCLDFIDMGGHEQLTVNGSTFLTPGGYGELMGAPAMLGGVNVTVSGTSLGFGFVGTITLVGAITDFKIGGQEFWIDNVCIIGSAIAAVSGSTGHASMIYCSLDCDLGVDNGSQAIGNQWGNVIPGLNSWQAVPGDIIFTEGGIDVSIDELDSFLYPPNLYNKIEITTSPVSTFGIDEVMHTNNTTAMFDLSAIVTDSVCIEWLDLGGFEVLEINGALVSSPNGYGQLLGLPSALGGTSIQITGNPILTIVGGIPTITGYQGKILIIGNVDSLRLGGQEFWIDNLCVSESPVIPSVCVGDLDDDGVVSVGDILILLGAFGSTCP